MRTVAMNKPKENILTRNEQEDHWRAYTETLLGISVKLTVAHAIHMMTASPEERQETITSLATSILKDLCTLTDMTRGGESEWMLR